MKNRAVYLKSIKKIQKSLMYLSNQLEDSKYDYRNLESDIRGYLTELQYNNKIPKNINLKEAITVEFLNDNNHDLHVFFSKELEDYLTDSGKHIIPEMLED